MERHWDKQHEAAVMKAIEHTALLGANSAGSSNGIGMGYRGLITTTGAAPAGYTYSATTLMTK